MKVLVLGSGGREHALAWKAAGSPRVSRVYVAPGNAGTALDAGMENVAIDPMDFDALTDFAPRGHRPDDRRPGSAAGGRRGRSLRGAGPALLRSLRRRSAARGFQGLQQGFPRPAQHSHGSLRHLQRARAGAGLPARARRADRRQGRRPRCRQGRDRRRDPGGGRGGGDRHARRQRLRRPRAVAW
jgi:hypothetical protein